jgi:hypothetical protein
MERFLAFDKNTSENIASRSIKPGVNRFRRSQYHRRVRQHLDREVRIQLAELEEDEKPQVVEVPKSKVMRRASNEREAFTALQDKLNVLFYQGTVGFVTPESVRELVPLFGEARYWLSFWDDYGLGELTGMWADVVNLALLAIAGGCENAVELARAVYESGRSIGRTPVGAAELDWFIEPQAA